MNIGAENECLLSKWLYKLINEDGLRKDLLKINICKTNLLVRHKENLEIPSSGRALCEFGAFNLNDAANTRFWEDKWIETAPLKQQFFHLYIELFDINMTRLRRCSAKFLLAYPLEDLWQGIT
jgi:hypothetical protein